MLVFSLPSEEATVLFLCDFAAKKRMWYLVYETTTAELLSLRYDFDKTIRSK